MSSTILQPEKPVKPFFGIRPLDKTLSKQHVSDKCSDVCGVRGPGTIQTVSRFNSGAGASCLLIVVERREPPVGFNSPLSPQGPKESNAKKRSEGWRPCRGSAFQFELELSVS